jgi:hypothetical protein
MSTTKAPSQPLYPAYLPTRPDGYAATIDVPPFEGDEPGIRADPAKPHLLRPNVEVTNITPRIGTELRGIQLSELSEEGLEYANSFIFAARKKKKNTLISPSPCAAHFQSFTSRCVFCALILAPSILTMVSQRGRFASC